MDYEETICQSIYWRKYEQLDRAISNEIGEWGFDSLRKILLTRCNKIPQPRMRDGLLHILGLSSVRGIELDPEQLFKDRKVCGDTPDELKEAGKAIGHSVIDEMLARRNTFFLDIDRMSNDTFAVYVPRILETRKQEIVDLESPASIWDVVQTAYGFSIFATGGYLTRKNSPDHKRLGSALLKVSNALGKVLEIKDSPLHLGSSISGFENCSEPVRNQMWHLLRFKTYKGKNAVRRSAKYIESHGDSRIAPFLHNYLKDAKLYFTAVKVMRALGKIGLEESAKFIKPFVEKTGNWQSSAEKAIAIIPGKSVTEIIVEKYLRTPYRDYRYIRMLQKRPPSEVAPFLEQLKSKTRDGRSHTWTSRRIASLEKKVIRSLKKVQAMG